MLQKLYKFFYQQIIYLKTKKLLQNSKQWSTSDIQRFQWKQLKKVLKSAYVYVPFYRHHAKKNNYTLHDIKGFNEFKELVPIINKEILRANIELFLNSKYPKHKMISFTTGGSTGNPVSLWIDPKSTAIEKAFIHHLWSKVGYHRSHRVARIRGNLLLNDIGKSILYRYQNKKLLLISSYHATEQDYSLIVDKLSEFEPHHLHVYPSSLIGLALYIKSQNLPKIPGLISIFSASESLSSTYKHFFEDVFEVPVYSHYGMAEHVALAGFGERDDQYHFMPLYSFVELLPESNQPNLFKIIGSNFWNNAMILLRYDTGDLVELNSHNSGHISDPLLPPVEKLIGREQDFFVLRDKSLLSVTAIVPGLHWSAFQSLRQLQFIQLQPGKVIIHLETTPDFSSEDEEEIKKIFYASTNEKLKIELRKGGIQMSASGKVPIVIQSEKIKKIIHNRLNCTLS